MPPAEYQGQDVGFWLKVPIRNVGAGVALLGDVHLILRSQRTSLQGKTNANAVPAGDFAHLLFDVNRDAPDWPAAERAALDRNQLVATIASTDNAGRKGARAPLHLLPDEDGFTTSKTRGCRCRRPHALPVTERRP